jgi:glutathione synthase/RimK-type ligase-like ATP-grasp enzyme
VNVERLRAIAFAAANAVGVSIFGGDVVVLSPNEPVLIDLNDWPSFAPFRDAAAEHIAEYAVRRAQEHLRHKSSSSSTSLPELTADLV